MLKHTYSLTCLLLLVALAASSATSAQPPGKALITVPASITETVDANQRQAQEWLEQAVALGKAGRDQESEALLLRVIALPEPTPAPGQRPAQAGGLGYLLRDSRSGAQQLLGEILFARGDFAGALQTFRTRLPIWQDCGNGAVADTLRQILWQGACLEGLGHTQEAVKLYTPFSLTGGIADNPDIARRLEQIYAANNQSPELLRFADLADTHLRPHWEQSAAHLPIERRDEDRPSRALRGAMQVRALEDNQNWAGLVALLDRADATQSLSWLVETTAHALARHPQEAVPALTRDFEASTQKPARCYALGLCATPDALRFLQGQFTREDVKNVWFARSLVYALTLAGESGTRILAQAELSATDNLLTALQLWRQGKLYEFHGPGLPVLRGEITVLSFPPVAHVASLPSSKELMALTAAGHWQ